MLKNHPKGLLVLALTNMGERFGYYTMIAILTLYMQAKFGFSSGFTSMIYGLFLALVYFLPIFGGIIADKWLGYGKTILIGVLVMFGGYLLLAAPSEPNTAGKVMMFTALVAISAGTGLFKGNLQALVGKLYDAPEYRDTRDIAFSIFYMFINIGAFFAPSMANTINKTILEQKDFVYDASVAKNYVALNDKVVDEAEFMAKLSESNPSFANESEKKQTEIIRKAKKKAGVMFAQDEAEALFQLKAAGIYQLSQAEKISDPAIMLSRKEYELLESRKAEDKAAIQVVKDKIAAAQITDPNNFGGENENDFARNFGKAYVAESLSVSYSLSFAVACISLIISVLIFLFFKKTWKSADIVVGKKKKEQDAAKANEKSDIPVMSKQEVRDRMIALFLVFFVVIFFWMAFHQNGLCMTFFARDYTMSSITPTHYMLFSLLSLLPVIAILYGIYATFMGLFGSDKNPKVGISLIIVGIIALVSYYFVDIEKMTETIRITPQIFQQFNPFFIIVLTPIVVGIFTALNKKGKEPSAPRKIGIGMLIAAVGFLVLTFASIGLPAPSTLTGTSSVLVSPNWLIGTYFTLTIAELFLSPMGLSFVSKVAPPQYSGLMQGGWLAATAVGNLLVGVMGTFWEKLSLVAFWSVLIICCLLSALFIFSVMKKLEKVTN